MLRPVQVAAINSIELNMTIIRYPPELWFPWSKVHEDFEDFPDFRDFQDFLELSSLRHVHITFKGITFSQKDEKALLIELARKEDVWRGHITDMKDDVTVIVERENVW